MTDADDNEAPVQNGSGLGGDSGDDIVINGNGDDVRTFYKGNSILLEFCAGAASGMCGMLVGYPFDTLKVLAQSQKEVNYPGITSLVRKVTSTSGRAGFLRGVSVPLLSYTVVCSTSFGTYNFVQKYLDETGEDRMAISIASFLAGTVQLIPAVPMETVKTRIQVTADKAPGMQMNLTSAIKTIFQERGVRGFYAGLAPHALRDIPGFWLYFTGFAIARENLYRRTELNYMVCTLLAGGFGGVLSWMGTYPFDVMKTRQQAQIDKTMRESIRFFRKAGLRSLFRGMHIGVMRSIIADGTVFFINGEVSQLIRRIIG